MGFLAPLFLLAAVAVAIPLVLHLFQRRDPQRVPFPAIRYLRRAERDHARSIRLRQLLLLALRILVILLVVGAGARVYLEAGSSSHEPTALVLILDNSLSSGVVVDRRRTLDRLTDRALESLDAAGPDDRVWVIRAGEPWDPARPTTPEGARVRVRETEPSPTFGDLTAALRRGASLARGSELPAAEIHLLSDLQASAFAADGSLALGPDLPVLTLLPAGEPPANRWVSRVRVGGGLPPPADQATEVVVGVDALPVGPDSIPIRLTVDGRVRGAALAPPGSDAVIALGPFAGGVIAGMVEIDPDALRADDRRHFAFRIRPPSRVRVAGSGEGSPGAPDFLSEALEVLEEGNRIRVVEETDEAEVLLSRGGEGLESLPRGIPTVVIPPSDPTLLPALNRRLARAGIPVELGPGMGAGEGETRIRPTSALPELGGVRVYRHYTLSSTGSAPAGENPILLATGAPWLVTGEGARGRYLIVASSLDPDATNLPVSAAMIPFLEWTLGAWPGRSADRRSLTVGEPLPRIEGATAVEDPEGTVRSLEGTPAPPEARIPGVYRILRGDSVLDAVAANPPVSESDPTPVEIARLRNLVGPGLLTVSEPAGWPREIFVRRKGPELWRPLLAAAFLVLLAESLVAAGGAVSGNRKRTSEVDDSDLTSDRARV